MPVRTVLINRHAVAMGILRGCVEAVVYLHGNWRVVDVSMQAAYRLGAGYAAGWQYLFSGNGRPRVDFAIKLIFT